ncbi:MAG: N-acetylneuraminate synthase family protein, partial [Candidatus Heimdallarchaeaceae archaeon]
EGNDQIMLMHGFQSYPTKLEDVHLKFIPTLEKLFDFQMGFADHTDGGSDMALMVPLLALPFGITFLEKHITHDREKKCEDFESALNPDDFNKFVSYVREAEKTLGKSSMREFSKDELEYRKVSKKRVVANEDIKEDEKITRDKITFKRANEGLYAGEVEKIIGRVAKEEIKKDEPLTLDKLF